ncbi:MAG: SIS domain-containing protein [Clostridia bacterium]|nr:SIS domain-containing protein [Clostridia bacterium]
MADSGKVFNKLFKAYPDLDQCINEIAAAYMAIRGCFANDGKLLLCGNGGSAADCDHIVGELMKGFNLTRPIPAERRAAFNVFDDGPYISKRLQGALPAISLPSMSALISAYANDVDPLLVYAQQVYGYGRKGDVLLCLSTSGNSKNICYAAETARVMGLKTVAVTGVTGGRLATLADITVRLPKDTPYEVQELTLPVYHAICAGLEADFFSE